MKMTRIEKFLIRTTLRVYLQRKFEAPKVLSNLNIGKESVCLEIGCGQGAGALLINQYTGCNRIIGVDIDPDMVEAAKRYISHPPKWARNIRTDNIEFICQDATELSFPAGCFDAAFLFGVLDHITEWRKAISEVFRVLKIGGVFSFEDFLLGESSSNRYGHVPIGEAQLKDALESSGFSIQSFTNTRYSRRCYVRAVKSNFTSGGGEIKG